MAVKEYDSENPVTMAGEPSVACVSRCGSQARVPQAQSMSVDEYIEKVKKALDKRYENL